MIESALNTTYSATLDHLPSKKIQAVEAAVNQIDRSILTSLELIKATPFKEHLSQILYLVRIFQVFVIAIRTKSHK